MRAHPVRVLRDVVIEPGVAVGECSVRMREDREAVDLGQRRQGRVAVRLQEVLPRPCRQVDDLAVQVLGRHESTGRDRRRAWAVALVVGDHREVDLHNGRAGCFEVASCRLPAFHDRCSRLDPLPGRAADPRRRGGPGMRIGVDVHPGDADAGAVEGRIRCQRPVRLRSHRRGARQRYPRLRAPEVAADLGVVRDDHVEHLEQVGHGTGVRHDHVHRRHERPVAAGRDHAAGGCVGAERVVRGGAPAARPGLLAETEGSETRRGRGAGAVRGAGREGRGEEVAVVRALGAAVDPALHAAVRHRRHVRQPEADRSARAQPLDRERVALRDEVGERWAAGRGGEPAHEVAVLRGVRDAVEGTECLAVGASSIGCSGLRLRLRIRDDDRVERARGVRRVEGRDARPIRGDQLDRGRLATLECAAQLGDRCLRDLEGGHATAGCCCVMQWMPPPRSKSGRASTVTTRRPGYAAARISRAAASARSSPKPHATTPSFVTRWLT
ncbi:hypothetical protein SRABI76_03412 [Microbacterium oxydans]|nr:hypothetical protein SRABI76_03412 [Microbacterium oxydans]